MQYENKVVNIMIISVLILFVLVFIFTMISFQNSPSVKNCEAHEKTDNCLCRVYYGKDYVFTKDYCISKVTKEQKPFIGEFPD